MRSAIGAKAITLQPGEIYKVPLKDGAGFAYLRVVLHIAQLEVTFQNPLCFVSNEYLLQVSKLQELNHEAFHSSNLLVNGVIIQRYGPWKKHGFEKVGEQPVRIEEVEMPCYCTSEDVGNRQNVDSFCRGEIRHTLPKGITAHSIGCYLCLKAPESLMSDIFIEGNCLKLRDWFWRCDGRFSPQCLSIIRESGIDLTIPYHQTIPEDRRTIYENAIQVATK